MKDYYELDIHHSKDYYRYNVRKMRNNMDFESCLHTDSKAQLRLFMDLHGLKITGMIKNEPEDMKRHIRIVLLGFDN